MANTHRLSLSAETKTRRNGICRVGPTLGCGGSPSRSPGSWRPGQAGTNHRTEANSKYFRHQRVKGMHEFRCQICGERLETAAGHYAEGAHIRPLGRPHDGSDSVANVLCLCPNDHVRLNRGAIYIDDTMQIRDAKTDGVV